MSTDHDVRSNTGRKKMFFNQRRLLQFPLSGYAPCISCGRTRVALVVQKEEEGEKPCLVYVLIDHTKEDESWTTQNEVVSSSEYGPW